MLVLECRYISLRLKGIIRRRALNMDDGSCAIAVIFGFHLRHGCDECRIVGSACLDLFKTRKAYETFKIEGHR